MKIDGLSILIVIACLVGAWFIKREIEKGSEAERLREIQDKEERVQNGLD